MLNPAGVFSDQKRFQMIDTGGRSHRTPSDPAFTDTVDSGVSFNLDKEKIAVTSPDRKRFNVGNFHLLILLIMYIDICETKKRFSQLLWQSGYEMSKALLAKDRESWS